ncbi:MAG TPA: hypothetical protein VMU80_11690 [Bryobacteraceae bacterium]|nr:hypothetical protein [Bryobacteraceae bacterium]HUO29872.1 hypothetical protein [Bryobacteraceae bacterium]
MTNESRTFVALSGLLIVAVISFVGVLSMLAGLAWPQFILAAIGACFLIWTIFFTLYEFRRITRTPRETEEIDQSPRTELRIVIVEPPTGEPYPHHEHHAESPGQDQGQLTSRLPGSTPLVDVLLRGRRQH